MTYIHRKNNYGASLFFICVLLGFVALPAIAIFTFEIVRAASVKDQLRAICEASALAGAASLASSDEADVSVTHEKVINSAINAFKVNSIFENSLSLAQRALDTKLIPESQKALVFIELLDPNASPVPFGDPHGRIVHIVGSYGLSPVFGTYLGITGPYTIKAEAFGRVPRLDIVLCFDVSGSIYDQTPVTFVKRYWDATSSRIVYRIVSARSGAPTTNGLAQGKLFDILGAPPEGTGVNASPPQNLDSASSSSNSRRLTFSTSLRGSPNSGSPPGNYPSGTNSGDNYTFTDLIVNINENPSGHTFLAPWISPEGFNYPNIETVVEAARGNLENGSVFSGARLSTVSALNGVTPRSGYQANYRAEAKNKTFPLTQAQDAAINFFTIMNNNTEANFGLVTFASSAGYTPQDTVSAANVASNYAAGGTGQFPRPGVPLTREASQFEQSVAALGITVANGGTNIGAALYKANEMLSECKRPGSRRAIVLFTDGHPTEPGSNPSGYARSAA